MGPYHQLVKGEGRSNLTNISIRYKTAQYGVKIDSQSAFLFCFNQDFIAAFSHKIKDRKEQNNMSHTYVCTWKCLSSSPNNTIFKNQELISTCNGNHYITKDKAESCLNLNTKLREAEQYNAHSLGNSGTGWIRKWMNHRHKRIKLSNKSITENYSWAGILQNARIPSLQEQEL